MERWSRVAGHSVGADIFQVKMLLHDTILGVESVEQETATIGYKKPPDSFFLSTNKHG